MYTGDKNVPAGDRFLYHKSDMVIIELYNPRVTHKIYNEENQEFSKLKFFYFTRDSRLIFLSYILSMQLYIRRCFIICTCNILVHNVIIKDIFLKEKRCSLNSCTHSKVDCHFSMWCPGSDVVLDCIYS